MLDDDSWIDSLDLLMLCKDEESVEPKENPKVLGFEFGAQIDSPNASYCKGLLEGLLRENPGNTSWGCTVIDDPGSVDYFIGKPGKGVRIQLPLTMQSQVRDDAIARISVAFSGAPVREIVDTLEIDEIMCERLAERVTAVKEATSNHDSVKPKAAFCSTVSECDTPFSVPNILQIFNSLRRNINALANGRGGTITYGVRNGCVAGLSITKHPPDYLELLMHCATCLSSPQIDLSFLSMRSIPIQAQPNTYIYEVRVGDTRRWGYKPYYTDTTREVAYLCHVNNTVKPMSLEIQNEFKKRSFYQHFQAPTAADPPRVSLPPELYDPDYKTEAVKHRGHVNTIPDGRTGCWVDEQSGELLATCAGGHPLAPCTGVVASCQKRRSGCRRAIDKTVAALGCALCRYYVCDTCFEGMFKEAVAKASLDAKKEKREAGPGLRFLVAVLGKTNPGQVDLGKYSSAMRQLCTTPGLLITLALMLVHRAPSCEEWRALGDAGVHCADALVTRLRMLVESGSGLPEDALNYAEITACIPISTVSQAASQLLARLTPTPSRLVAVISRCTPAIPPPAPSTATTVWSELFAIRRHELAFEAFFTLHSKYLKPLLPEFCGAYLSDKRLTAGEKIEVLKKVAEHNPTVLKRVVKYLTRLPGELRQVAR